MGLGLDYSSGSGAGSSDIVPYVKYDARAGRFFRNDRTEVNGAYSNNAVDVTSNFKAVMDLENLEVGYLKFGAGTAPEFMLVKLGDPIPHKPADAKFKQGMRVMMKLHKDCGGDIRELTSNAAAFLKGFDDLHNTYEAEKGKNAGKLPVVVLKTTMPITSGSGDKKSTNYQPVFAISGWAPRPADLVHVAKQSTAASAAAPQTASPATAPTTGSTPVGAPQPATADAEDFG